MKKSVRLLSLLLAVAMLFGIFAVSANAEGEVANVTIKTNTDTVVAGDVITVTVNVANNYYATSMRWPVLFSNAFFELVEDSITAADDLNALGGSVKCTETPDNTVYTTTYTSDEYTGILLQWTAAVTATGVTPYNQPDGMDCFTFQLRVKNIEQGSSGQIVIPEDYPRFYNYILTDMEEPFSPDKVVQCKDLVHNFTNATVKSPVPELIAVEGSDTVIDKEKQIIRGIPVNTADNLDKYVRATIGDVVITASREGRMGTGTVVRLDLKGEKIEEHTVIIVGDVNGDAYVDYTDLICLDLYEGYGFEFSDSHLLAADLTGNGVVDAEDKIALDSYLNFEGEIDQATGIFISA